MPSSMLLVVLGALLVLCGVVLVAGRLIWTGPISRPGAPGLRCPVQPWSRAAGAASLTSERNCLALPWLLRGSSF